MDSQKLVAAIRQAFAEVELGDGIGLWQAQAIDDYEDEATRLLARERDEKLDWARIPLDSLTYAESSLSFFDAAGMRFHLPAFLIVDIEKMHMDGPVFHLTHMPCSWEPFTGFDRKQRQVISDYLEWCFHHPNYQFQKEEILRSLNEYWRIS